MNTLIWGPHAWSFLFGIANYYDNNRINYNNRIKNYYNSFYYLGKVLPCKYCRESYKIYFKKIDIRPYLEYNDLVYWLYIIHNNVNDKLRKQGKINNPDPSYSNVYNNCINYSKSKWVNDAWNFLFCIAHNYSNNLDSISKQEISDYYSYFYYLQYVLPCKKIRFLYSKYFNEINIIPYLENIDLEYWLYNIFRYINRDLYYADKSCVIKSPMINYSFSDMWQKYEKYCANYCIECDTKHDDDIKCNIKSAITIPRYQIISGVV